MSLHIGDIAPDFTAATTEGPIRFHTWKRGKWAVLFSHPRDFTPVCTTELGRASALHDEFTRRDCRLIGLSVDSLESHRRWDADIAAVSGHHVSLPMIADTDRHVSRLYGMLEGEALDTATVRSVFVIANTISDEEAWNRFPPGVVAVTPYLRFTPNPAA